MIPMRDGVKLATDIYRPAAAGVPVERARFLEGLPTRYIRTHSADEVDAHFLLSQQLSSRPVAVEIHHERGFYKLTLLTKDRPALFASVAGAISSLLDDPSLGRRLGAYGRARVGRFDLDRLVADVDGLYRSLLAEHVDRHAPSRRSALVPE